MPIHAIRSDANGVYLEPDAYTKVERSADDVKSRLPPPDRDDMTKVALLMQEELQQELNNRQLISSLPKGHPDRLKDPGRPDYFWEGLYLVGRAVMIKIVWGEGVFSATVARVGRKR